MKRMRLLTLAVTIISLACTASTSVAFAQDPTNIEDIQKRLERLEEISHAATISLWVNVGLLVVAVGGIVGFLLEYRQQHRTQGYSTYLQTSLQYMELEKLLMEKEELQPSYEHYDSYKNMALKERKLFHWHCMLIMLFETVYRGHQRKWMRDDEYGGWEKWMYDMLRESKIGKSTWDEIKDQFSEDFRNYIDNLKRT